MIPTVVSKDVLDSFIKELEREGGWEELDEDDRLLIIDAINLWQAKADTTFGRILEGISKTIDEVVKNV